MVISRSGKYCARLAASGADVIRCQQLRYMTFIKQRGLDYSPTAARLDRDEFDPVCQHVMIENARSGKLVCCFRILALRKGSEISRSYSAKFYELSKLAAYPSPMIEIGRFGIHPAHSDPRILRAAWCAMIAIVDQEGVEMLFGCSSFHGIDARAHRGAFALLMQSHLAPNRWLPSVKAPSVFCFARKPDMRRPDMKLARRRMPPLLRSYLGMGGWVSDHAVIDNELNTLHVFTGVEINMMRPGRVRQLRRAEAGA